MTQEPPEPRDAPTPTPEGDASAWSSPPPVTLPTPALVEDHAPPTGWLARLRALTARGLRQMSSSPAQRRRPSAAARPPSAPPPRSLDAPPQAEVAALTEVLATPPTPAPEVQAEPPTPAMPELRVEQPAAPEPEPTPSPALAHAIPEFEVPRQPTLEEALPTITSSTAAVEVEAEPLEEPEAIPEVEVVAPVIGSANESAVGAPVLGRLISRLAWPSHPRYWNGYLAVLTALGTLTFLVFLLAEPSPRWILLLGAGAVVAGLDGTLRATWRGAFAEGDDGMPTTPYLFLPALYVFAAPLLIEHNVTGHLVILAGLGAGLGLDAIAVAEVLSVRTGSPLHRYARMVTTAATYFTAFALLSLTDVLHLALLPEVVATGLVATMLAIEVVREGEVDPLETAVFATIAGLLVAQARWLLFFLPLDGYPGGLALVLVFYLVTGVLHSYVLRQLTNVTAVEYGMVTAVGLALLVAARAAGLA